MRKKLLVIVAAIMTIATLFTLVSIVSAAEEAKAPYLYAYYSEVEVDGVAYANGAEGPIGTMGATAEYDSDAGVDAEHAIEYVLDTYLEEDVQVAAAWNLEAKELYLLFIGDILDLEIEIGGATLTVDPANGAVEGIDGAEAEVEGNVVEIAIPLEDTLELAHDGEYVITDLKIDTDVEDFEGKLAFTGDVPIIVYNADQDYYAKTVAIADVKNSLKSAAGRYYRHWVLRSVIANGVVTMDSTATTDRSGALLYGYNPMYGDIDAESYLLKADVKINGMAKYDKAAIATSRDIAGLNGGAKYDTTKDHVAVYIANNTNSTGAVMYCCSIFDTNDGLYMVVNSILGEGKVIKLGVQQGEEFELKFINNVVSYDKESQTLEKENYNLDVYVNDVLVGSAENFQVKGTSVSEYGFGYNVMKEKGGTWNQADALVVTNLVSAYTVDFDTDALLAMSKVEVTTTETTTESETTTVTTPAETTTKETTAKETTTAGTTAAAPTTTKAPATTTEAEKGGCGSSLVAYGALMVVGSAVMAVVATSKKKED